ncbi:hypothetical protein BaRGS_00002114 [Batillaria attramentaria]|uniref:Uncharacterized protein n=1 Tax=Batillaria attramentaria TaxID=370345 RepID=A0ABD0M486_9CAEN
MLGPNTYPSRVGLGLAEGTQGQVEVGVCEKWTSGGRGQLAGSCVLGDTSYAAHWVIRRRLRSAGHARDKNDTNLVVVAVSSTPPPSTTVTVKETRSSQIKSSIKPVTAAGRPSNYLRTSDQQRLTAMRQ